MSKRELIDAIRQHNRTVPPEFLARFAESDLKAYLDRVCSATSGEMDSVRTNTVDAKRELVVA